jgi:hypothetical protein
MIMERSAMFQKRQGARFACVVEIAALALITAGCASWPKGPAYMRVAVSEKSVVYLQFQRDELRAATTIEALPDATPARLQVDSDLGHFTTNLPIPAEDLPAGLTVKAEFWKADFPFGISKLFLFFRFFRHDERNVEWQYITEGLDYRTGGSAADAPLIDLPDIAKIQLAVTGQPSSGKIEIVLYLGVAGQCAMNLYRTDGQDIAATVRVLDETGKEVVRKQGTLKDFGFS